MESPPNLQIVLTGFSGSGKTTVLKCLQHNLRSKNFEAVDLDDLSVTGFSSIAELVEEKGWDFFRAKEKSSLEQVLKQNKNLVLALGGGSLDKGREILDQFPQVRLIHLQVSFEQCWERISQSQASRPLVARGRDELKKLYEERQKQYLRAHFSVDGTQSPEQVALAIQGLLGLA
ncbi:MAG: AAA family ATPase [Bacteriovoracaceae bacterium]|nr:AAA family ATPase [Bacteriovoracaceae bacterium]